MTIARQGRRVILSSTNTMLPGALLVLGHRIVPARPVWWVAREAAARVRGPFRDCYPWAASRTRPKNGVIHLKGLQPSQHVSLPRLRTRAQSPTPRAAPLPCATGHRVGWFVRFLPGVLVSVASAVHCLRIKKKCVSVTYCSCQVTRTKSGLVYMKRKKKFDEIFLI